MANENRTSKDCLAVVEELRRHPYRYDFFQALRLLENANIDRPRWGQSSHPWEDAVRLGQRPSMAFAASTLAAVEPGHNGQPACLLSVFFGLFGPNGALPIHLTELAYERFYQDKDETFARFMDVFHHRMLSLYYHSWAVAQPTVNFDRPEDDRFKDRVGAFLGQGFSAFKDRDAMPDLVKRFFCGHLSSQSRHVEGLTSLVSHFFELPVEIEEFVGQWLQLTEDLRCHIGWSTELGVLDVSATIGSRVWVRHLKFRLIIGPMKLSQYQRFLPGGNSLDRLIAVVKNYIGDELIWDVNLILKKEEVSTVELGRQGQLGWSSWLAVESPEEDARDLCLNPFAAAS